MTPPTLRDAAHLAKRIEAMRSLRPQHDPDCDCALCVAIFLADRLASQDETATAAPGACIGGTAGCAGVGVYAPGGGVKCNACGERFRAPAPAERTAPDSRGETAMTTRLADNVIETMWAESERRAGCIQAPISNATWRSLLAEVREARAPDNGLDGIRDAFDMAHTAFRHARDLLVGVKSWRDGIDNDPFPHALRERIEAYLDIHPVTDATPPAPPAARTATPPESDPVQRARRALSCLYVAVEEHIARDVNEKVEAAFAALSARAQDHCSTPGDIAQAFHDAYEALAPAFGYRTREASAKPWDQVPPANRDLMIATVRAVLFEDGPFRRFAPARSPRTDERDPNWRVMWVEGAAAVYRHEGRTPDRAMHLARWLCDVTHGPASSSPSAPPSVDDARGGKETKR